MGGHSTTDFDWKWSHTLLFIYLGDLKHQLALEYMMHNDILDVQAFQATADNKFKILFSTTTKWWQVTNVEWKKSQK